MTAGTRWAIAILMLTILPGCGRSTGTAPLVSAGAYDDVAAEVACGQCKLGLEGAGCDLAVRIDGTAYYVDGTGIDDHGDAHAADGLCNMVRQGRVSGAVVDGRFKATAISLLPSASSDGE